MKRDEKKKIEVVRRQQTVQGVNALEEDKRKINQQQIP